MKAEILHSYFSSIFSIKEKDRSEKEWRVNSQLRLEGEVSETYLGEYCYPGSSTAYSWRFRSVGSMLMYWKIWLNNESALAF